MNETVSYDGVSYDGYYDGYNGYGNGFDGYGYYCITCGAWVFFGENHECYQPTQNQTQEPPITLTYTFPCCACLNQIQQLLEKLDKLITLSEKEKKIDV